MHSKRALLAFLVCLGGPAAAQSPPESGSVIEGDVVDGDTGHAIAGARVKLDSMVDAPRFTFADRAGHFRFAGLTEKSYGIVAQQIGYMGPQEGPQSFGGGPWIQIGHAEPVRIILVRYGVIEGTVTDSGGAPAAVAGVTLLPKGPRDPNGFDTAAHVYTDQRGVYRIPRLHPGTYYLRAEATWSMLDGEEQGANRATYYGGALDTGGAKPIDLARGHTVSNINVEIQRRKGVRLSGRIVKPAGQDGNIMTTVRLRSVAADPGTAEQFGISTGDTFEIQDVLPGKYTLTATMGERYGRPEARSEFAAAIQTVEVQQAEVSGLTVALDPPHDLSGTVHIAEGCRQGVVHLNLMNPMRPAIVVKDAGAFVLKDLLPAQNSLNVYLDGEPFGTVGALRLGGRESQHDFIMEGSDFGPLQVEITCPRGSISGEVRDADGAPVATAMIAAVSTGTGRANYTAKVRQEPGRFEVLVVPGVYDVFACTRQTNEPRYSPDCQKGAEAVTIADGADTRLVLTLPPARRKEGPQ